MCFLEVPCVQPPVVGSPALMGCPLLVQGAEAEVTNPAELQIFAPTGPSGL